MAKTENNCLSKVHYYIGIDVSKATFDYCIRYSNQVINGRATNNVISIDEWINLLHEVPGFKIRKAVFGLEYTGIYNTKILNQLHKAKANIVLEPAMRIKNSLGLLRGKNDKLDASRIAKYLIINLITLRLWQPRRAVLNQLAALSTLRERFIRIKAAMLIPLKEDRLFLDEEITEKNIELSSQSISSITSDIAQIDKTIKQLISGDDSIRKLMEIMLSVTGIGPVIAIQILIHTNEFKSITHARSFASYCGVAPFTHSSGTSVKKATRVSHVANKRIKALLHNGALTCILNDTEIKAYYHRRVDVDKKNKMATINAIKFKLICRVFACIRDGKLFDKKYVPKKPDDVYVPS